MASWSGRSAPSRKRFELPECGEEERLTLSVQERKLAARPSSQKRTSTADGHGSRASWTTAVSRWPTPLAENAIRAFMVGRRNWLLSQTQRVPSPCEHHDLQRHRDGEDQRPGALRLSALSVREPACGNHR